MRVVKYYTTIIVPNEKKGGILLPKEPYKEDLVLSVGFDTKYETKEHFLQRMEYLYDTMERAIKDRTEQLVELSK